ncbi:MAG: Gingipain R1 [Chloroflexi bacterium]|nr:Gingipain R1 [Chloroflexota bacterium]
MTAYFGHGSLKMWGKDKLFTTENTTQLNNKNRLPIILNFTCLTGLFTHPTEESLAESLLFHPAGGAVAVLAPSSLTLPTNQSYLSDAIAQALLSGSHQRLGDVVLEAWRQVPVDDPNSRDVLGTFMLFGDPALVIKFE